jgi:hypothetical protein
VSAVPRAVHLGRSHHLQTDAHCTTTFLERPSALRSLLFLDNNPIISLHLPLSSNHGRRCASRQKHAPFPRLLVHARPLHRAARVPKADIAKSRSRLRLSRDVTGMSRLSPIPDCVRSPCMQVLRIAGGRDRRLEMTGLFVDLDSIIHGRRCTVTALASRSSFNIRYKSVKFAHVRHVANLPTWRGIRHIPRSHVRCTRHPTLAYLPLHCAPFSPAVSCFDYLFKRLF